MELTIDQALKNGIEAHKIGNYQEADRYYTAILKAQPKHPDANHNLGVLAVDVGSVQESLPFFTKALDVNPNIAQFWLSYIDALIKLDQIVEAKLVLDQAKRNGLRGDAFDKIKQRINSSAKKAVDSQDPQNSQLKNIISLYKQHDHQNSLTQALQLLEKFPTSAILLNIIGTINRSLGKLEEAIQAYHKALAIKPNYAEAYYNVGNALKDQGKTNEAIKAYKKAIKIKPNYAEAHYNVGTVLQDQGKIEEAAEAYKKAVKVKPDYAEAYFNKGVILLDQDKLEEATKTLKRLSRSSQIMLMFITLWVTLLKIEMNLKTHLICIKRRFQSA